MSHSAKMPEERKSVPETAPWLSFLPEACLIQHDTGKFLRHKCPSGFDLVSTACAALALSVVSPTPHACDCAPRSACGFLERDLLEIEVLVFGRDPRVSDALGTPSRLV